ncbi:MAG: NAD(+)/NADH kinase [Oscillospiraceae bacterium]|jgi:NAD+ kinase|nr:NAD(+)/NADH kinase [Oscillospiraceae bacterium]
MIAVLFANVEKDPGLRVTKEAAGILEDSGCACLLYEGEPSVLDGADAVLSFGGDGTFLRCAKLALPYGVPVLGVCLGHTGFLSRVSPDELSVLRGLSGFPVADRTVLDVTLLGCEERHFVAVNDAVFSRGVDVQTVSLTIDADGTSLGSFLGDGVILSSSTGSTGYAFSAGGPVADPSLSCIVVTPICAHASRGHAFVLSPERVLTVTPEDPERRSVFFSADGEEPVRLREGAEVRIARTPLRCLEPVPGCFFDNVRIHRM